MLVYGEYFYGNKISEYGLENGYVDYETLAKAFDMVLNNDIIAKTFGIGYWEQESGFVDGLDEIGKEQKDYPEIYQYYIVSDSGAKILKEIDEIVFYNEELDMYVWGVTHFGTGWSYVLTNIKCNVSLEVLNNENN